MLDSIAQLNKYFMKKSIKSLLDSEILFIFAHSNNKSMMHMENRQISIGVFIDGGYYAKVDEELMRAMKMQIDLKSLLSYIRNKISTKYELEFSDCQITECHYFRGRYRVNDAQNKHILYVERKFEDALIENDVVFHYKHLREVQKNGQQVVIEKGIDVWYALESYELALIRKFDFVILITGDADHEMLIKKLKSLKVRVMLLTWDLGRESSTSPFLHEEAGWHIELSDECRKEQKLINKLCKIL